MPNMCSGLSSIFQSKEKAADVEAIKRRAIPEEWQKSFDAGPSDTDGEHYSVLQGLLDSLPESVNKATATTSDVIEQVVKTNPKLMERKTSWLDMLRDEDAQDVNGVPLVGVATTMISHTWQYVFNDTAQAIIAFAQEYENKVGPCYIWMDLFVLNQFATESFDANWLRETFTNVIKDIGLTVAIMSPFEDPIAIKRVWCLWELYLSVQFSNLQIVLPPDQRERFHDRLRWGRLRAIVKKIDGFQAQHADAFDPKSKEMIFNEIEKDKDIIFNEIENRIGVDRLHQVVISAEHFHDKLRLGRLRDMLKQIDGIQAQHADAFDPKDKEMIFNEIENSIGFDRLNQVVITALTEWIWESPRAKK